MTWTAEQKANAQAIYRVGLDLGASLRDVQVAIMAAIVESGLRNLDYGDRDSIGLFQQRDAWGSRSARLDPYSSARMFFLGGAAGQEGLLDIANRDSRSLGSLAQDVQVSAYPDRYAEHQAEAAALLKGIDPAAGNYTPPAETLEPVAPSTLTEVDGAGEVTADETGIGPLSFDQDGNPMTMEGPLDALTFGMAPIVSDTMGGGGGAAPAPSGGGGTDPMQHLYMPSLSEFGIDPSADAFNTQEGVASGWRAAVLKQARGMLGVPYVWGGTSYSGVDCSGLVSLLYNKQGFSLPRLSADQARSGKQVPLDQLKPGDLVGWDNSSRNNGADHIAIYIGNGQIIEAPRPGGVVQVSDLYDTGNAWGVAFDGGWKPSVSRSGARADAAAALSGDDISSAISKAQGAYKKAGVDLSFDEFGLVNWEDPTIDTKGIDPGSLVAWENENGQGHLGVFLGNNQFIEARSLNSFLPLGDINVSTMFPNTSPSRPSQPFPNGTSSESPNLDGAALTQAMESVPTPRPPKPPQHNGGGGGGGGHAPYDHSNLPTPH